jgi:site-specific recombinase XerD
MSSEKRSNLMQCIKCKKEIPSGSTFCNHCGKKQATEKRRSRKRANGQGSVYKLPGNRAKPYAVVLPATYDYNGGKKQSYYGYYTTKTEALNALNDVISKGVTDNIGLSLTQIFNEWKTLKFRELSKSAVSNYNAAFKFFEPIKDKKFKDIKAVDVQEVIDHAVEQKKKRATCEKIRSLYSQLCQYAMSIDLITQNYAKFLKLPSIDKKEKEIFTPEEISCFKAAASESDTAKIVMILIYTGMRINELFLMKKQNVYLESECPYMIGGLKTDAGKDRVLPLHSRIVPYIDYFMSQPGAYLISNSKGGMKSYRNFKDREYYPLLDTLGIDRQKTLHCTRHTFATALQAQGTAPEDIIKLMGHTDYSTTTENYVHQQLDQLSKAVQRLTFCK